MIRRISATNDDRASLSTSHADHGESSLTYPQQTHLGEVVEVVLVDHREAGLLARKRMPPFRFRLRQHRIEQCYAVTTLSHQASSVERTKRRIRLHRGP